MPQSAYTASTSVAITKTSASTSRASSSLDRSLSTTASTPTSVVSADGRNIVGTPPPPAQMSTTPWSSSQRIGRISKMCCGWGEGTTRRQLSPSGLKAQPFAFGERVGLGSGVDRADELGRVLEGRVARVDLHHREDRRERDVAGDHVAELLLEDVADHPLGLRAEDVERVRVDVGVRRRLEGEQPDLGSVAVGEHELVRLGDGRQGRRRAADVHPLVLRRHRLAPLQQGVAAERHHDAHGEVSPPGWRP